jgi:hypothetical protein
MTVFYRKLIPSYTKVASPLKTFLKGDADDSFDLDIDYLAA